MEEEINKLRADLETAPEAEGVYRLKFMQRGLEKKKAQALAALDDEDDSDDDGAPMTKAGAASGRKSYGGGSGSGSSKAPVSKQHGPVHCAIY